MRSGELPHRATSSPGRAPRPTAASTGVGPASALVVLVRQQEPCRPRGITGTDDFEVFARRTAPSPFWAGAHNEEDDMFTDADRVLLQQLKTATPQCARRNLDWRKGRRSTALYRNSTSEPCRSSRTTRSSSRMQAGEIEAFKAIVDQLTATQNLVIDLGARQCARRGNRPSERRFLTRPPGRSTSIRIPRSIRCGAEDAAQDPRDRSARSTRRSRHAPARSRSRSMPPDRQFSARGSARGPLDQQQTLLGVGDLDPSVAEEVRHPVALSSTAIAVSGLSVM